MIPRRCFRDHPDECGSPTGCRRRAHRRRIDRGGGDREAAAAICSRYLFLRALSSLFAAAMTRTTRGSSASPAKGAAPAKARVVATPGATLPSPRKVGRPPKAESGAAVANGRGKQQEIPTPPSTGANGKSAEAPGSIKAVKSAPAPAPEGNPPPGGAANGDGKRFCCPYCGQAFSRKYDMQKHSRKHTGDKPYKCGVCGRQFVQVGRWVTRVFSPPRPTQSLSFFISSLAVHMRAHTGEMPYKCSICDKGFAVKERLRLHARTHTGERP